MEQSEYSLYRYEMYQKYANGIYIYMYIFQAYYLAVSLPIEKAPTKKITDFNGGVTISEILKYPVRGLVFEGGCSLEDLSNAISDSCICLQNNNIPYNVLISDSGKRIFLLPQVKKTYYFLLIIYALFGKPSR